MSEGVLSERENLLIREMITVAKLRRIIQSKPKKELKKQVDFHFVLLHRSIVEQISMYQPANRLIYRIDLQYYLLLSREVYSLASLYRIKNL